MSQNLPNNYQCPKLDHGKSKGDEIKSVLKFYADRFPLVFGKWEYFKNSEVANIAVNALKAAFEHMDNYLEMFPFKDEDLDELLTLSFLYTFVPDNPVEHEQWLKALAKDDDLMQAKIRYARELNGIARGIAKGHAQDAKLMKMYSRGQKIPMKLLEKRMMVVFSLWRIPQQRFKFDMVKKERDVIAIASRFLQKSQI